MSIPQQTQIAVEAPLVEVVGVRFTTTGFHNRRWACITHVRWRDVATEQHGQSTVSCMIEWLQMGGEAFVRGRHLKSLVHPFPAANPTHLRTDADTETADNLLELPEFDYAPPESGITLPHVLIAP